MAFASEAKERRFKSSHPDMKKLTLNGIRANVRKMIKLHGWDHDPLTRSIYLSSELGEVIKELLDLHRAPTKKAKNKAKEQLGYELYDLIWNAVALADKVGIDLNESAYHKIQANKKREFRPSVKVKTE